MVTDDTLQETIVSPSKASFASARNEIFVENSLKHLEDMESDIKKSRKMSIIKEKYKVYCDKIEEEFDLYEIKSTIYEMAVKRLKEFVNLSEEESTKERCFKCIEKCKMLLNWLNSQRKITLKKGCKKCKILLNYSWLTGQSKIGMEKGRCRPTWSHFRQFWRNFRTREPTPAIPQSKPNILHLKYPLLFRLKPF